MSLSGRANAYYHEGIESLVEHIVLRKTACLSLLPAALMVSMGSLAQPVEEMIIIGIRDTHTVRTDDTMVAPPDTAQLLRQMPGANVNKNGELTGIAQYRGMYGDRVNVSINGGKIASGGPNAMDSPLHYAPVALLESLTIQRGITPVSMGQETLGGHVEALTYRGDFADSSRFTLGGRAYAGGQSFNNGYVGSAFLSLSNREHLFSTFLMTESADDSRFADGKIRPSGYDRERIDLGYGFRRGDHELYVHVSRNETGNAGTAALPMDIESFDTNLLNAEYTWHGQSRSIHAELYASEVDHWMSNHHMRRPPLDAAGNPNLAQFRRTFTTSESIGFKLKVEQTALNGLWRLGTDTHIASHDALIGNPNAPAFFVDNFRDVERDVFGVFVERELQLTDDSGMDFGIRVNHVRMNTGEVASNLNPMNLSSGGPFMMNNLSQQLAGQFNAQQQKQNDTNLDWFARYNLRSTRELTWYAGAARKTRSPSYQERYLWSPMESTGGLADGKTYIGQVDLKPEVSHELEFGFDLLQPGYALYPRVFYKRVSDYIHGVPSTNPVANTMAQMMSNMGMGTPDPLQFANVSARFHGFDMEGIMELSERLDARMVLSVVRGERKDIDDNLYRVSPDNLILALDYRFNRWMGTVESINYARQQRVADTNLEQRTSGYSLLNLSGRVNILPELELVLGVNNLLDRNYRDHLSGYNRTFNPDVGLRERLPGLGRNVYGRMMWHF